MLDRLTDDEPLKQEESRTSRVISLEKYKTGVRRDLEWLFNTNAFPTNEVTEPLHAKYLEAARSVINFGVRQLCGQSSPNLDRLKDEITEAIRVFEPRISPRSLTIRADLERNFLTFDIEGELWTNQRPEHLHLKTIVDVENGQCLLGDAPHG